jgi:hypothetical protein
MNESSTPNSSEGSNDQAPLILDYRTPPTGLPIWKTVASFANGFEANLAMLKLQDRGLKARVDSENLAVLGPFAGATPGAAVQVMSDDVEAAQQILRQIEDAKQQRRIGSKEACPACGSSNSKTTIWPGRWVGLTMLIAGALVGFWSRPEIALSLIAFGFVLLLWPVAQRFQCKACGHHWRGKRTVGDDDEIEEGEEDDEEH